MNFNNSVDMNDSHFICNLFIDERSTAEDVRSYLLNMGMIDLSVLFKLITEFVAILNCCSTIAIIFI